MHVDDISGVALARRDGVNVAERAGGMADRDLALACTPATRFQIASVSKQFTAAAVLLLASQFRLSLDDPVTRWFGGCPRDWQAITVHHLLTHTSGLGHLHDFPSLDLYQPIEPAQELRIFQEQPLLSAPGSRYYYSSPGYTMLAWIAERTAGQPYASFLTSRIFAPLGMTSATSGDPPGGPGMARGYHHGEPVPSFHLATIGLGAGDIWCTAADLLRWDEAVASGELVGCAGPGEQGALDVLSIVADSSVLVAVIKVLPEFLRSRKPGTTVTVTVKGKRRQLTVTSEDAGENTLQTLKGRGLRRFGTGCFQPVLDDRGELAHVGSGQVAQAVLHVRPGALHRR